MKKAQLPLIAESDLGDTEDFTASAPRKFTGTKNLRHLRVIQSLMIRPRKREEIDSIAGASNGPALMAELRRRGLHAPCHRTPGIGRDGYPTKFGIYELDGDDRRAVCTWQRLRDVKAKP